MKGLRTGAVLLLVLVMLAGGAWVLRARQGAATVIPVLGLGQAADLPRAPEGVRIRVQVLNTTRTRGLARRATRMLRDRGFDVVEMGTTTPTRDTTLVLDRSGHPDWAAQVATVMGVARAVARPDTSRYLDITVLVGSLWRPPAQPLYP
ncbi:MAG: hypothetical protein JWN79_19 [Gemmatimonadetes bacterium]|jgi:hypothetical protein|nr:hypothetical protein [Gemmatimonadota bacterium]